MPGSIQGQSLRAVRPGGEIALIGFVSPKGSGINFFDLFISGATFRHIAVGSRDALNEAFAYLDSGLHVGKVVFRCA